MRGYLNDLETGRYGYGIASSVDFFINPHSVTKWREMLWTGTGWGWEVSDKVAIDCMKAGTTARRSELKIKFMVEKFISTLYK